MNHRLRRAAAIVVLLAIVVSLHSATLCAGWSGSAADRMACCQREAGHCAGVSADACCADGEQRQNPEQQPALIFGPLSVPVQAVLVEPLRIQKTPDDPRSLAAQPATYLLDTVFRI